MMNHAEQPTLPLQQRGVALFTALVFLIVITLLSLAAMRSSTLELKMATNEQEFTRAVASAQSAIDSLLTLDNLPVNAAGYVTCYSETDTTGCDDPSKVLDTTTSFSPATNKVRLIQGDLATFSCRSCETSGLFFKGVTYRIESTYDNTAAGGARAEIAQGFMRLVSSGS